MPAWGCSAVRALALAAAAALAPGAAPAQTSDLVSESAFRVCADPGNYPMSDDAGGGFENRLAVLLAEKLGRTLQYTWFPMATGFVRNTLRANRCDVVIGYAQGDELVLNTNHYYTSSYVLVVPADGPLANVEALSDPALADRRLGVVAGTPPSSHMARYGLLARAKPYQLFVDRRVDSPVPDMLADLAEGRIDGAVVWGPLAGPIVKDRYPGMKVIPLLHEDGAPRLFYRVTMGVRQGDRVWQRELNSLIRRHQDEIDAILADAGVPLLNDMGTALKAQP